MNGQGRGLARRWNRLVVASLLLGAVAVSAAVPASAATGDERIHLALDCNNDTCSIGEGTFTATGVFDDAGRAQFRARPQPDGTVFGTLDLDGSQGDIAIAWSGVYRNVHGQDAVETKGTWTVVGSSKGYAGLEGSGSYSLLVDFAAGTVTGTYHGTVTL